MFRDLKEYQEIAKIYADKVSKPEELDENARAEAAARRREIQNKNKPKTRAEVGLPPKKKISPFERKFGAERNEKRMISQGVKKPIPSTDQIRKDNPKVVPGTRVNEIGQKSDKPSEGDFKKDFPDKPKISKFTKQGKPRTKAQMMAAKRIGSGTAKNPDTTIAQVKQKNQDDMRARAKAKFEAFKKRREEKKAGVSEAVGAALKLGGMIAPKIPSALKAIGAGAATGAAVLGIKKKEEEEKPSKKTPTAKQKAGYERAAVKRYDKMRDDIDAGRRPETKKIQKAIDDSAMEKAIESDMIDKAMNSPEAQKIEADKIKKARQAFRTGTKQESYTPYDMVLEYLLSTEQVATIEEANYVMTEMDAETIQGIVEMQGQINRADIIGGTQAAKNAAAGKGKYTPGKGVTKDFKLDPAFKLPKA